MDVFYRERSNGCWEYWTYCEGRKIYVTEKIAMRSVAQGDKLVEVR